MTSLEWLVVVLTLPFVFAISVWLGLHAMHSCWERPIPWTLGE